MGSVSDLPLLVSISVALSYALVGGLLARRVGLPPIVGYMLAGVALGPFTPGYQGDGTAIHQLAEFGVILLMFGVGLHFSFKDLWQVRDIAIPGAILQMTIATIIGYSSARLFGASPAASLVLGLSISIASTVVLMRGLMDTGQLDSLHGRVAIGWLVLQDLAAVVILVLLPLLSVSSSGDVWSSAGLAVGKALLFVVLMLAVGPRVVPALVARAAQTRSREIFVLVALTAAAGTALVSYKFFGVSLALGAFLAGVIIGQSPFSHQVGADLLPFREAFAVLFFVSVGMLVNPSYLVTNWVEVLAISGLIVVGNSLIALLVGFLFAYPARTSIVIAAGLSQIGEFSFILGQAGVSLGLLSRDQYSLILAGAIISITLNPFMFKLVGPVEQWLQRWPAVWRALDRPKEDLGPPREKLTNHVVIVGCGRVGRHIAEALGRLGIPRLVVEADPARLAKLHELNVPVLYGDASSSEILQHAGLDGARALVTTLPDDAAELAVVAAVRKRAPHLRIVARASTWDGARQLRAAGAQEIVRPELEGGVEIVRRTLLDLDLPLREIQRYTELVRREGLDESERPSADRARVLDDLVNGARSLELVWVDVIENSPVAGRTLAESALRTTAGVSVVAIGRTAELLGNPGPDEVLQPGDRVAVIGTPAQITEAERLLGCVPIVS